MNNKLLAISVLLAGSVVSPVHAEQTVATELSNLKQVVSSDFRQSKNIARDEYRHPVETLSFFGIKRSDTVIELWPGGGWYAEILAPYLAKDGQYIGANFDAHPADKKKQQGYFAKAGRKFEAWIETNKAIVGSASTVTLSPPDFYKLGEEGSADAVLTFRNLHNWDMKGYLEPVFEAAFNVLKTGGTFGVVEHRGKAGMDPKTGYVPQDAVIALAEKVGFRLVATSEVNANPKDIKDYPKGVWTLPPRLALGDVDREKYIAIGESDRMTLKFIK